MTTLLIGRQEGNGIKSSSETCHILRLRRLHHGKFHLAMEFMLVAFFTL